MTIFVAAYDTEQAGACLSACGRITRVHREMGVPATFFIKTRLLEGDERRAYQKLLSDDLFEVASHTVTHVMLRDHPALGVGAAPRDVIADELARSKATIEDAFGRPCEGLRSPVGFEDGLGDDRWLVELVAGTGYAYSSSQAWGPKCTIPAPLEQARTYAAQGFPELWELPAHGWHENVLKGHNATPGRYLLWPPAYPDHVVTDYVRTPEEEFAVHRYFVDRAVSWGLGYVSLVWHPWSLGRFDPEMRMPRLVFEHAAALGVSFGTFAGVREAAARSASPGPAPAERST